MKLGERIGIFVICVYFIGMILGIFIASSVGFLYSIFMVIGSFMLVILYLVIEKEAKLRRGLC